MRVQLQLQYKKLKESDSVAEALESGQQNESTPVVMEVEEVESKRKAVRVALKIARRIGENKIIDQDDNWNLIKA